MVGYSSFRRRTVKWWKKAFFHIFSVALLNGYICYKEYCSSNGIKPMFQRVFRKEFVKQLIESVENVPSTSTTPGRKPQGEVLLRLQGSNGHFFNRIPATGKKSTVSRACVVCSPAEKSLNRGAPKKRYGKETGFWCKKCQVALCQVPCHELFHTCKDYIAAYKRWKADNALA